MLTCVACPGAAATTFHDEDDDALATPSTRHALKSLSSQLKDMALKASGAYRQCKPCSRSGEAAEGFRYEYRRAGESSSSTPGKEVRSGEATPSMSGRTETGVVLVEEEESKEWVAQVEPGVLITFLSLPQGGNDLKRIRFSREMFNKWQAQRWWAENHEKVTELYNVKRYNHQAVPLPTPPRSEDEKCELDPAEVGPVTPPLTNERLPRNFNKIPTSGGGIGHLSSESQDHNSLRSHHHHATVPKLSGISGAKTERSSMDASVRTTSSSHEADRSGELSISNASDHETEWVEQDEPGVYITIRALPDGVRELRRVRFSRERFGEMHARLWWEENRARIHEQYL